MDALLVVLLSVLLHTLSSTFVLFIFYRLWILPYLTNVSLSIPEQVRTLVEPYIDSTIAKIEDKIDSVTSSVKASSARFQRSVDQAVNYADSLGLDLESDEGVELARSKLESRYSPDIAIQAIGKIASQIVEAKNSNKESRKKGGNEIW